MTMNHTKDEALLRTLQHLVLTIDDLRRENAQMRSFLSQSFRQYNPSQAYGQDANFYALRTSAQQFEALLQTNKGHANLLSQQNPYEPAAEQAPPYRFDPDNPFW